MRILDQLGDNRIKKITMLLTEIEVKELFSSLKELIENKDKPNYHTHISDQDYSHEITVSLYSDGNTIGFNERIKKLILEDK